MEQAGEIDGALSGFFSHVLARWSREEEAMCEFWPETRLLMRRLFCCWLQLADGG